MDIVGLKWILWVCNGSGSVIDIVGLQRTKRVCNGYSWSLMDNSGSVQVYKI